MNNNLEKTEARLAAQLATIKQCLTALDKHETIKREAREVVAAAQARYDSLAARDHALHSALAEARRQFGEAQEATLKQLVIYASGAVVRLHALDPIEYDGMVIAAATKLRTALRSGYDTPGGQPDSVHTLVREAIKLAPDIHELDRPVYELGATVAGLTDWPTRRERLIPEIRQLLADLNKVLAKISPPLEAA